MQDNPDPDQQVLVWKPIWPSWTFWDAFKSSCIIFGGHISLNINTNITNRNHLRFVSEYIFSIQIFRFFFEYQKYFNAKEFFLQQVGIYWDVKFVKKRTVGSKLRRQLVFITTIFCLLNPHNNFYFKWHVQKKVLQMKKKESVFFTS